VTNALFNLQKNANNQHFLEEENKRRAESNPNDISVKDLRVGSDEETFKPSGWKEMLYNY